MTTDFFYLWPIGLDFPKLKTVEELQRFLGMVNVYRSYSLNAAQYQQVLNNIYIIPRNMEQRDNVMDTENYEALQNKSLRHRFVIAHTTGYHIKKSL